MPLLLGFAPGGPLERKPSSTSCPGLRSLCYRIKKGFYDCIVVGEDHDDVSVDRNAHQMRPDAIKTPEFVDTLQNMIDEDFEKGLRVNVDV